MMTDPTQPTSAAAPPWPQTLIEPAALAARLDSALIVDVSFDLADPQAGRRMFEAAHLPGAQYLHLDDDLSGPKQGQPPRNGRHPLPERAALARRLAALGLRRGQPVAVYDRQQGMFAARLWWLLRWLGHAPVALLDGGLQAWQQAGLPIASGSASPVAAAGDFAAGAALAGFVDKDDIAANLRHRARLLLDARAPERFSGANETIDPVAGHIPGAVNLPFKTLLTDDGRMLPQAQLRARLTAAAGRALQDGPLGASQIVAQCGSGVTACVLLLALEHAGLGGARLYPGSWSEYCVDARLPVATDARAEAGVGAA
jgi:thiosulfate/3-mercaptopyruvate sulfurtransferase